MSILDKVKVEQKEAKPKTQPKVYHLVWDRAVKGADGKFTNEPTKLSKDLAQAMSKVYGTKIDPLNINTGAAKAFLESLLDTVLKK